jgi:hypothetical protein
MPGSEVRARIVDDIQLWQSDGLIAADTAALLRERYQDEEFGIVGVIKYLGIAGGLLAFFGLLGLVSSLARSEMLAALMVLANAAGFFYFGLRLSLDLRNRFAVSSKAVLALGAVSLASGVAVVAHAAGGREQDILVVTGLAWLPLVFVLAYRFQNSFLLILGLLGFFHWVGSCEAMLGRSTYAFEVDQPLVMVPVSLVVIAVGIYHERALQRRTLRFYLAYQTLGLLYLDLSLLILSIWAKEPLPYVLLMTLAALAQIIAGARLKNGLFTGFGVTFLAIDLYTRYYEHFWDKLDKGLFFLAGGALLFGAGVLFERTSR